MDRIKNHQWIQFDERKHLEQTLQVKLRTLMRKTDALKGLLENQRLKLDQTKNLVIETRVQLDLEKKSNKSKKNKIELIKQYIASRKASVKKRREAEISLIDNLKQNAHRRVNQLTSDVFPIEEINLL